MTRFLRRIASVVLPLFVFTATAIAQIPKPEAVDSPLREELRGPVESFLRNFHFGDGEPLLPSTRMGPMDDRQFVFRVEHRSTCVKDLCLTIIGSIRDAKFQAHAMFFAGKMVTQGDTFPDGAIRPAIMFYRSDNVPADSEGVVAIETRNGWMVVPVPK